MTMDLIKNPKVLKQQEKQLQWANGLLVSAQKRRWFGKVIIEFKRGMIDIISRKETLKPPKEEED